MINEILQKTEEKMKASAEILKKDLATIRTGHAAPSLVEHIKVDYAGVPTALNQLAGISAPGAKQLVIQPWDQSSVANIEKAILKSDLGLTPANDGRVIRLNIPPLTEERRQELIRVVRKRVEDKKIVIRNLRREAMDELRKAEKDKVISQDDQKRALERLQKITDSFVADTDQIGRDKEAELTEV
ncbi:MAG: ribosome recycling factor [Chloroflexota bacterium]